MREGDEGKREHLLKTESVLEVIDIAIQFELAASTFYRQLYHKVGKPLRWLVKELAEEESQHAERLKALREHPDLQQELAQNLERAVIDPRFSDAIQTPDLDELADDQAVLQYALSREQLAMEQYRLLAQESAAGAAKDLFQWLANEEVAHKGELEKRYYELVHRGGGV